MIGVTRQDSPRAWGADEVAEFFQVNARAALGMDARSAADCQKALYHLFECLQQTSRGGRLA